MITIYSHKNSKRLQYILKLVFTELLGIEYSFTTNTDEYKQADGAKIQYTTTPIDDHLFLYSENLLFETNIQHQEIQIINHQNIPCLFPIYVDESILPFDIFSAVFYLISRYEEYLPHKKDMHKRFVAAESFAFQNNFLHKPVINIWVNELKKTIQKRYPNLQTSPKKYRYTPTYDIDIAWSYKNKGLTRNIGGSIRDLIHFNTKAIKRRYKVLFGKEKDPYDTYQLQKTWQNIYQLKPIYFILFGELGPFDKNISPLNFEFQDLIKDIRDHANIGIHPSYESNDDTKKLKKEIENLGETIHVDIIRSRQHYLKLNLPQTYRSLLNLGIKHDYTMGYASQVGFRAGIASSFFFYDLDLEIETKLRVHPFAVMDGTLKDYLRLDPNSAKEIISSIISEIKNVNGHMISLWHNESLSNEGKWKGWIEVYEHLLKEAQASD